VFTNPVSRRRVLTGVAVAVPVGTVSLLVPSVAYADDEGLAAERVVTKYFGILNAGMASADGISPRWPLCTATTPSSLNRIPRADRTCTRGSRK